MSTLDHPWFQAYPVHHNNILRHWENATPEEIRRGMRWYAEAHQVATDIAHGDTGLGAGMLAVYSPQQGWSANLLLAARVLHTGAGIGGAGCGAFASTTQKLAAERLLAGEHYEQVLSGPKVRAFARLIEHAGDADPARPRAVIDRHALSVAHGSPLTIAQYSSAPLRGIKRRDGIVAHPHYDHVVTLYRRAATEISRLEDAAVAAHQVQAVTWLVRQRLTQASMRERGMSLLDHGRERARLHAENAWRSFRATHLPHLSVWPDTGYLSAV